MLVFLFFVFSVTIPTILELPVNERLEALRRAEDSLDVEVDDTQVNGVLLLEDYCVPMLKHICWNARGVGNSNTVSHIKAIAGVNTPDILAILEPKIQLDRLDGLAQTLGFDGFMHGKEINNHIWVLWQAHIKVEAVTWSAQQGGVQTDDGAIFEFNEFLIQAGLLDAGFEGNPFTWSNNRTEANRVWKRLDRVLLNGHALTAYPTLSVKHLARMCSDHCPLFVVTSTPPRNAVFGDIRIKLRDTLNRVNYLEGLIQQHHDDGAERELAGLKALYADLLGFQLEMLKQKSRLNWLCEGDRNSKFYHATIKARAAKKVMNLEIEDGVFSSDRDVIGKAAVDHFSELFQGQPGSRPDYDFSLFDPLITDEDNQAFTLCLDEEEVLLANNSMNDSSAPGPDGFTGRFYKHCWLIIKQDLMTAIELYFHGFPLPVSFTATTLTLIPKVASATSLAQLRPISLCNFNNKIISRIISARLAVFLRRLISEEQVGFVQGRYSVKWDGKLYGFFHSWQGVRQGDPLSPTLFVLAMEWLS
ncbi:hypothetical protein QQ045_030177 [Rhodiola kirilowii]